jgi:hypothetical protein
MKKLFILMVIPLMLLVTSFDVKANDQILPSGIDYLVNNGYTSMLFTDVSFEQGLVLDLDGAGSLGNGLLVGDVLAIRSSNVNLKYIEFRTSSDVSIRFNIYNVNYTLFDITYNAMIELYEIDVLAYPNDIRFNDVIYYVQDAIIVLPIANYNAASDYWAGYDDGEQAGYYEGLYAGKDSGYDDGYEYGFEEGLIEGYNNGYNDALGADLDVKPLFDNLISFIGTIFSLEIFPGMTIGALAIIPISFAIFKWFMKMFGGK